MSKSTNAPPPKVAAPASSRSPSLTSTGGLRLQRKCACGGGSCQPCSQRKRSLQRAARPGGERLPEVPAVVDEVLASPGEPLTSSARSFMEPRFGRDFSRVRVHTDARAAESAQAVQALAYTVGNDIVFDRGQYQPETPRGQYLLAHELAHTLQQQGQGASSSEPLTFDAPGHGALEQEAEAAASSIMARSEVRAGAPPRLQAHAAGATLSRKKRPWGDLPESTPSGAKRIPANPLDQQLLKWEAPPSGSSSRLVILVDTFYLPLQKKPVLDQYERAAEAGQLEATLSLSGQKATQLLQKRDGTKALQNSWLLNVGGDKPDALARWETLSGEPFPRARGKLCQIDHALELQLGGGNNPENLAPLAEDLNEESGRLIRQQLLSLANAASALIGGLNLSTAPEEVTLSFEQVAVAGGTALSSSAEAPHHCHELTERLKAQSTPTGTSAPAGNTPSSTAPSVEDYPIQAGSTSTVLEALISKPTPLDVSQGRNRAANQLIPGLRLTLLQRPASKRDTIDARIDDRRKTRLPIELELLKGSKPTIVFNTTLEGTKRKLSLSAASKKLPGLTFTYPYLSEGTLQPQLDADMKLTATGKLTPSVPLMKKVPIDVFADFEKEEFRGSVSFPADKLTPPVPGLRFTRSEMGVELSPRFNPHGVLAFEAGPKGKPWLDGSVTATFDAASGFVARGEMNARLPGVDVARGTVEYANHRWTGVVEIASAQLALPFVKQGDLRVAFAGDEAKTSLEASGGLTLEPPGFGPISLKIERTKEGWGYKGKGSLDVPSLGMVEFALEHDGTKLTGEGRATVTRGGLSGTLGVDYDEEKGISGSGDLKLKKDKLDVSLAARLREGKRLSGSGKLKYALTPSLEGTASVELTEEQLLKVNGGILFSNDVSLFKEHPGSYTLFSRRLDIPIVGLSVGPVSVGLIARISGELSASYSLGPGTLKNIRATAGAQFNLADLGKSSLSSVGLKGMLDIPARAGLSLSVRGAVGLSAGVASVTGGLTATGGAHLVGGLTTAASIQYTQGRFILDLTPTLKAALVLSLGLSADITAEAGVGFLSYERKWVWRLANHVWDSGLVFGLTAPIHYDSASAFKPPSPAQLQWIIPNIDVNRLTSSLLERVRR
jgi:hypothetical protein